MSTTLTTPTVHLNGTGATGLKAQYAAAYEAVNAALGPLAQSAPHGRDYYVQKDSEAYAKARDEHVNRLQRLSDVRDELLALFQAVDAQERKA